jgi:multidrug resistance efflux pump
VQENDIVKKGEIILVLKHSIEQANMAEIKSQISTQSAQIKVNQINIKLARIKYDNANIELRRLKKLLTDGAETQQVVDNATTELKIFLADIDQQKALVEVSRRKLAEIRKQMKVSNESLKQRFVKSPIDGILLEMSVSIGGVVNSQTPFAQLASNEKTIAVCEIDEMFAPKIKINQRAIIRDAGSSDTLSSGTVYFVSTFLKTKSLFTDQAGEKEDRRVREIKIRLDNPQKMLLNTRVECIIMLTKNAK